MKAIKERAKKYARKVWRGGTREYGSHMKLTECDFIAGAQSEREELTRWRNPNEELPENNSCVLMKVSDGEHERIYLGARQDDVWMCDGGETVEVVGYDRNKDGCACRDCARFGNCSYNEMTGNCRWYEREDGTVGRLT